MRPERERIAVDPARLAWGTYNHTAEREEGEGDIHSSYSADLIAMKSAVRNPFKYGPDLWINTGSGGFDRSHECYRLKPVEAFTGRVITYQDAGSEFDPEKGDTYPGDRARNNPNGFYHGMKVMWRKQPHVLVGPPVHFVEGEAVSKKPVAPRMEQLDLFAGLSA